MCCPSCPPPSLSKTVLKSQESDPRFPTGEGRDEEGGRRRRRVRVGFLRSCCPIRSDFFFSHFVHGTVPAKVTQLREQWRYSGASRKGVVSLSRHQTSAADTAWPRRRSARGYDDGGHSAGIRLPVPCCWTAWSIDLARLGCEVPIELAVGRVARGRGPPCAAAYGDSIHSVLLPARHTGTVPGLVAHASPSVSATGFRCSPVPHHPHVNSFWTCAART